jgi:hypothetical protein
VAAGSVHVAGQLSSRVRRGEPAQLPRPTWRASSAPASTWRPAQPAHPTWHVRHAAYVAHCPHAWLTWR